MVYLKDIPSDEYTSYFDTYLNLVDKESNINNVLQQSLDKTLDFINSIDKPLDYRYESSKWSIGQVIQHNIDTERVFAYRALRFLRGDDTALSGFDQDVFVDSLGDYAFAKAELLKTTESTRNATIALFENVTTDSLLFKGNASGNIMTARVIPFLIAGHNLHHENVIRDRYLS
ncbi:DinB family protein [Nonlabens sp. Asnod3-A02]|uniref:DinB family protein n=1 Tax=Nonlabens sp. Asnod3-A02 TaxID=3160579 RepID=UPI0038685B48